MPIFGKRPVDPAHDLEPIRFTAQWVSQNEPSRLVNFCDGLRILKDIGHSYRLEDLRPPGYLTVAEVCDFMQ